MHSALPWFGRDESNLLSVRRPGKSLPRTRQRRIGTRDGGQKHGVAAVGMRNQETMLVPVLTVKRDPLGVARPLRGSGGFIASEADAFPRAQLHHPELVVRAAGEVTHRDRICYVTAVRREGHAAYLTQPRQVVTGEHLGADCAHQ